MTDDSMRPESSIDRPGPKEIAAAVDDLRVARKDLTDNINRLMELTQKLTELVVLLIRAVK